MLITFGYLKQREYNTFWEINTIENTYFSKNKYDIAHVYRKKTRAKKPKHPINSTVHYSRGFTRCMTINSRGFLPKGTLVSEKLIYAQPSVIVEKIQNCSPFQLATFC